MRTFTVPNTLLNAANAATNQTSAVQSLNQTFSYSIQANLTGSVQGDVKLQASVDYAADMNGNVTNSGNWSDITSSDQAFTAAGSVIWNVSGANYPYVRAVWTSTGGSGTRTITVISFVRNF